LTVAISCKNDNNKILRENYKLNVYAKNFPDSTKVILWNRDLDKNLDTSYVINETFSMIGKVNLPSLCYLNFFDKAGKSINPYKFFFLENKDITIRGEYSNFLNASVEGSVQSDLSSEYYKLRDSEFRNKQEIDFLFKNANNQMSISQLLYRKKKISKDSLLLFCKKLDSTNSNSPKGLELLTYAKTIDIKIGDKFKEIIGKDLKGKEHKLSDFYGKVILLDFWGSGCAPCRLQNKNEFPKLIEKYNNDDFMIISYSLDTKEKYWIESSEDDKITWLNISDLKGMKGGTAKDYAITAIPNSFLIDKNGIIVKSFIGYKKGQNLIEHEIDKLIK